jgi:hypothetical protein
MTTCTEKEGRGSRNLQLLLLFFYLLFEIYPWSLSARLPAPDPRSQNAMRMPPKYKKETWRSSTPTGGRSVAEGSPRGPGPRRRRERKFVSRECVAPSTLCPCRAGNQNHPARASQAPNSEASPVYRRNPNPNPKPNPSSKQSNERGRAMGPRRRRRRPRSGRRRFRGPAAGRRRRRRTFRWGSRASDSRRRGR